jgi:hypothetical protein
MLRPQVPEVTQGEGPMESRVMVKEGKFVCLE